MNISVSDKRGKPQWEALGTSSPYISTKSWPSFWGWENQAEKVLGQYWQERPHHQYDWFHKEATTQNQTECFFSKQWIAKTSNVDLKMDVFTCKSTKLLVLSQPTLNSVPRIGSRVRSFSRYVHLKPPNQRKLQRLLTLASWFFYHEEKLGSGRGVVSPAETRSDRGWVWVCPATAEWDGVNAALVCDCRFCKQKEPLTF